MGRLEDSAWSDPALRAFRADLDGDGRVSVLDFSTIVSRFNVNGDFCAPPLNPAASVVSDTGVVPVNLTVTVGQPVVWRNAGAAPHTATAASGLWHSSVLAPNQSFAYVFGTPGVFGFDSTQPGDGTLTGTVTVLAAPPPAN